MGKFKKVGLFLSTVFLTLGLINFVSAQFPTRAPYSAVSRDFRFMQDVQIDGLLAVTGAITLGGEVAQTLTDSDNSYHNPIATTWTNTAGMAAGGSNGIYSISKPQYEVQNAYSLRGRMDMRHSVGTVSANQLHSIDGLININETLVYDVEDNISVFGGAVHAKASGVGADITNGSGAGTLNIYYGVWADTVTKDYTAQTNGMLLVSHASTYLDYGIHIANSGAMAAGLYLNNHTSNSPATMTSGILMESAASAMTYGINMSGASIATADVILQNSETISNVTNGTVAISGRTNAIGGLTIGTNKDAAGGVSLVDNLEASVLNWAEVASGTTLSAGQVTRAIWNRARVTAAQTNQVTIVGSEAQIRIDSADLGDGVHAGLWAYFEQSGETDLASPGQNAAISATVEGSADLDLKSGATLSGLVIDSSVHDDATIGGDFDAIWIKVSGSKEAWEHDLRLQNDETISNVTDGTVAISGRTNAVGGLTIGTNKDAAGGVSLVDDLEACVLNWAEIASGTTLSAGQVTRAIWNRARVTAATTNQVSIIGSEAQIRIADGANLGDGVHAGLWAYFEQDGAVALASPGQNAGISVTVEGSAGLTVDSGASLSGIVIDSSVNAGASLNGTFDAIWIKVSGANTAWAYDLKMQNGETITNVNDGFIDMTGILRPAAFDAPLSALDCSNPPSDAELDAEFGTPAEVGAGWQTFIDDNGGGANFYLVTSDGTNWWTFTAAKAT